MNRDLLLAVLLLAMCLAFHGLNILDTKREIAQMEREEKGYRLIGDKMSIFLADVRASEIKERKAFIERIEIIYNSRICDTAPYPKCNGAEGCDTCENQVEE